MISEIPTFLKKVGIFFQNSKNNVTTLNVYTSNLVTTMNIEQAIQQKHFKSEHQKMHINILFTAAWLSQQVTQALKPHNISWQQFNILRILKGQYPNTVTVKILRERMINKMSNASRLVEKLRQKGFVARNECSKDRRRVDIILTAEGIKLIEAASTNIENYLNEKLEGVSIEEAQTVNHLLDKIRTA